MKERDIVEHLKRNWNKLFSKLNMMYNNKPIKFHSLEYTATPNWRCDMLAYIEYPNPIKNYKEPIYFEVKYNNNSRDLLYELTKGLQYIQTRGTDKYPRSLGVIADKESIDKTILDFIKDNDILLYEYEVNNSLTEFKIHRVN